VHQTRQREDFQGTSSFWKRWIGLQELQVESTRASLGWRRRLFERRGAKEREEFSKVLQPLAPSFTYIHSLSVLNLSTAQLLSDHH
jgi:hypothetical protein